MIFHDATIIYIGFLSYFYAYVIFRGFKKIPFLKPHLASLSFLFFSLFLLFLPANHEGTGLSLARICFYLLLALSIFPVSKRANVSMLLLGVWPILYIENLPLISSMIFLLSSCLFLFRAGLRKSYPFLLMASLFSAGETLCYYGVLHPVFSFPEFLMATALTILLFPTLYSLRDNLFIRFSSLIILPAMLFPFSMLLISVLFLFPDSPLPPSFLFTVKIFILVMFLISVLACEMLVNNFFKSLHKIKIISTALAENNPAVDGEVSQWPELYEISKSLNFIRGVFSKYRNDLSHYQRRLNESQKVINEFLRNVSHELRTPLAAITGYLSLLIKDSHSMPEREMSYLINCQDQSKYLLKMIESILLLCEIESGRRKIIKRTWPLKEIIHKVELQYEEKMKEKRIKYTDDTLPLDIHADPEMVEWIFVELIDNAVKFTPEGGSIIVHNRLISDSQSRDYAEISVNDTGVGVLPQIYEKIFDPFTQEDGSETRNFRGIGLGLTIAKKLVELHDGNIDVDSGLQRGSRFIFTLPLPMENN